MFVRKFCWIVKKPKKHPKDADFYSNPFLYINSVFHKDAKEMLEKRLKNAEKMPKNRGRFLNLFSYMKSVLFFFAFYHLAFLRDSKRFLWQKRGLNREKNDKSL